MRLSASERGHGQLVDEVSRTLLCTTTTKRGETISISHGEVGVFIGENEAEKTAVDVPPGIHYSTLFKRKNRTQHVCGKAASCCKFDSP